MLPYSPFSVTFLGHLKEKNEVIKTKKQQTLFVYLVFNFTGQKRRSMQPVLQFNHCNSKLFQQDNCPLFCTVKLMIR